MIASLHTRSLILTIILTTTVPCAQCAACCVRRCRELWLRFLNRRGSGGEGWLARLRADITTALSCTLQATAIDILEALLASYPKFRDSRRQYNRWRQLLMLMRRVKLRAARTVLVKAIAQAKATAAVGRTGDPFGSMQAARSIAEDYLISKLRPFHASPEFWACHRLWSACATPVSLSNFSLLRRFGKGSYGQVFAARKEDSLALFALKLMPFAHAASKRGRHHLRVERQVLARAAAHGSNFLSSLHYAFRAGPWLVLALPLLSGGTLQLQLDERGSNGLGHVEVRWVAAQLTLAIGAMHTMGVLHRDIKPSNCILNRNGYLVLSDFGLSGKVGASSRSGTRGYWSPETTQRLPQGEAADWWSLGVTLWYCACGKQPFHRRYTIQPDGQPRWEPLRSAAELFAASGIGAAAAANTAAVMSATPPPEAPAHTGTATDNATGGMTFTASIASAAAGLEQEDEDHPRFWKRRLSETDLNEAAATATAAAGGGPGTLYATPPPPPPEPAPEPPPMQPLTDAVGDNAAALPAPLPGRRRPRMTEEQLNYNTCHMPIDLSPTRATPSDLVSFVQGLLDRDADKRLGSGGEGDVRAHPFLGARVEWELLASQKLVAPFVPDPNLVYTPDVITEYSGDLDLPSEELVADFKDWDFDGEPAGYREELRQFVQKSSTHQILRSMEAPASVLAKLEDDKGEGGESATKSPHASSASFSDHSETGSWSKEGAIENWDSDEEKVEDE